jgi:hypothetical protein
MVLIHPEAGKIPLSKSNAERRGNRQPDQKENAGAQNKTENKSINLDWHI